MQRLPLLSCREIKLAQVSLSLAPVPPPPGLPALNPHSPPLPRHVPWDSTLRVRRESGTALPRAQALLSLATSLSAHHVCKVHPLSPVVTRPPASAQATTTALSCDTSVASELLSSQRSSKATPCPADLI